MDYFRIYTVCDTALFSNDCIFMAKKWNHIKNNILREFLYNFGSLKEGIKVQ